MSQLTVEERQTNLEKEVNELRASANGSRANDWRSTIGMFTGDEVMKEIDREALKFREADRRKARKTARTSKRSK